jgi:hypothetical protein
MGNIIKKVITIPIYNRKLYLYLGPTVSELLKQVEEDYGIEYTGHNDFLVAFTDSLRHKVKGVTHEIMGIPFDALQSDIAHECIHTAYRLLDEAGVETSASNNEPLAYLVSFLMEEVDKQLKKYGSTEAKSNEKLK